MDTFGGNALPASLPQSNLIKCKSCYLYFRWPRVPDEKLSKLYKDVNPEHWQYELVNRKDWEIAIRWINNEIGVGAILDIGCWDGKFLECLSENNIRHGIEINMLAANKASSRGVKIIANNISDIGHMSTQYNVVTAFNIIEHIEDPLSFLKAITQVITTNGYVIISSGNTEAITWRISGSRYWYCSIPEHISFINPEWCHFIADKLNLKIEHIERFSYAGKTSIIHKISVFAKNFTYFIAPRILGNLRKIKHYLIKKNVGKIHNYPPAWMTSKDHFIIIFKIN